MTCATGDMGQVSRHGTTSMSVVSRYLLPMFPVRTDPHRAHVVGTRLVSGAPLPQRLRQPLRHVTQTLCTLIVELAEPAAVGALLAQE